MDIKTALKKLNESTADILSANSETARKKAIQEQSFYYDIWKKLFNGEKII